MASPNYLGSATGLTGIPTLLLSGLQSIEDKTVQTALYQVQNWANSFFTWNFGIFAGAYVTGGVTITFERPFPSNVFAFVPGAATTGGATSAAFASLTLTTVKVLLYNGGTQIANGTTVEFSFFAFGH